MRFSAIITAFLLVVPAGSFAASKETQEIQRDIALLQEDVRTLQSSFDKQMATLQTLSQQALDRTNQTSTSMQVMERTINDQIKGQLQSGFAPVVGLGTKVDQIAGQVQTLSDAVQALNASLQQLHAQLTDVKNVVQACQTPPAPPPSTDPNSTTLTTPGTTAPAGPPPPAEILYQNAIRDKDGDKPDLALAEFRDFIKYYPTSDLAANAQFYIGTIHYGRDLFEDAIKDFDAVLEQYPKGSKTPDAFYYKGMSLLKTGRSPQARKEFNSVIAQFPRSAAADKARAALKGLGLNPPSARSR